MASTHARILYGARLVVYNTSRCGLRMLQIIIIIIIIIIIA